MKRLNHGYLPFMAVTAAVLANAPVMAQQVAAMPNAAPAGSPASAIETSGPADDAQVGEIIVTALKRSERLNDVPMSITAATGDQLAKQNVLETKDLVKIVPGLTFSESDWGTPIYTLRGIGFSDVSMGGRPTVSVYIDEAPLAFAIISRGASLDLERVEVLKGPQGTLFGQNATGGAINYIAAKPTESFKAGVDATYGRFNQFDFGGFVSGPISDTLSVRVALRHEGAEDWQKSYTHGKTLGQKDFSNGRISLLWKPTSDFKALLSVNRWIDHSDTQAAQLLDIIPLNPPFASQIPQVLNYPRSPQTSRYADWNPNGDYDANQKFLQSTLRMDYSFANSLNLTSISSYDHFTVNQLTDLDGMTFANYDNRMHGHITSVSQEVRIAGNLTEAGKFVLGVNYAHDKIVQNDDGRLIDGTLAYVFTPLGLPLFTSYSNLNDQTENTAAIFANADFKVTPTLTLSGGLRYTKMKDNFKGCTRDPGDGSLQTNFGAFYNFFRGLMGLPSNPPILPGGCATANEQLVPALTSTTLKENNLSWRAGVQWKPREQLLVYGNISKGYKAGGFPSLGASRTVQYRAATQESVLAYEGGFKATLLHRALQLNGAIFYYDYTDKQILGRIVDPILGNLLALVNVPKSDVRGAELQVNLSPVRGLSINSGVTYIDSRILKHFTNFNPDGNLMDFNHEAFPNTPKWQFTSDEEYSWPVSDRLNTFVGGNLSHQSATNSQLGESAQLLKKAYTLVDLRAGIETKDHKWRGQIWAQNVFNTYYWNATIRLNDAIARFAGRPATYGVSLSYRY